MKIAIISDLHLGFRQYGLMERENDFYKQLQKVCAEISRHEPNIVIIAGDLFNGPNPTPAAINAYREGIGSLDCDIICAIKGNHTMVLRDNHYSIDEYFGTDEFEGYYLLDDSGMSTYGFAMESSYDKDFSKYHKGQNVYIDGITYRTDTKINEFLEIQKELASNLTEDGSCRILVVHQSFKEFCGFVGEELSIEDIDYLRYDLIICGHIHSRKDEKLPDGTIFIQPGSIERMNTTEALDEMMNGKGFYLFDTETKEYEFICVPCERQFILGELEVDDLDDFESYLKIIKPEINNMEIPPVISYKIFGSRDNHKAIRDIIDSIGFNALINRSNIYGNDEEVVVEVTDSEIPTMIEILKKKAKDSGLNDDEVNLMVDLFNSLSGEKKEVDGLLDDYYKKHYGDD